jgi:hypothetical protein
MHICACKTILLRPTTGLCLPRPLHPTRKLFVNAYSTVREFHSSNDSRLKFDAEMVYIERNQSPGNPTSWIQALWQSQSTVARLRNNFCRKEDRVATQSSFQRNTLRRCASLVAAWSVVLRACNLSTDMKVFARYFRHQQYHTPASNQLVLSQLSSARAKSSMAVHMLPTKWLSHKRLPTALATKRIIRRLCNASKNNGASSMVIETLPVGPYDAELANAFESWIMVSSSFKTIPRTSKKQRL